MNNVWYIGELPPPYGGVTIKNNLVYENVYREIGVKFIDISLCKKNKLMIPIVVIKIIWCMIFASKIIVGVGSPVKRKFLLNAKKIFGGKKSLNKVIIIGMGGQMHLTDANDVNSISMLKSIDSVWLESKVMIESLNNKGIYTAQFFPNCRLENKSCAPIIRNDGKLRLVFFSKICVDKGVDIIIDAYSKFPKNVTLDFYGEIDGDYKEVFEEFLSLYPEVIYHGVFDSTRNDIYSELNKYDVELLPTKWKGEGVPGALIEAKMSGISAIVSDWNFNAEVVADQLEGIVLKDNSSEELVQCVSNLARNESEIKRLKQGAFDSRKRYCIETYKKELQQRIKLEANNN